MGFLLGFFMGNPLAGLKAMGTNLSGGEDYSESMESLNYGEPSNYLYKNLTAISKQTYSRKTVFELVEIQTRYLEKNHSILGKENHFYLKDELIKLGYRQVADAFIAEFMNALKLLSQR